MTQKERIEKLDKLFDHTVEMAMNYEGAEGLLKYTRALQTINWIIRGATEMMEDEEE